jgi:hypothetical protein
MDGLNWPGLMCPFLRNPLIFERARFRRFSAVRRDAERTNRLTRALISRQSPSRSRILANSPGIEGIFSARSYPRLQNARCEKWGDG